MSKQFYLTTPIYYVNDEPHIGHAYTTVLSDVLTRYSRDSKVDTYFLTGVDEHGQKVQQAAEKRGVSPQAHCDEYMQRFKDRWNTLNIKNDQFIRTTQESHKKAVTHLLQDLWDKKLIYKDEYEGWYSVAEERFLTDKEYEEGEWRDVKRLSETNYYFKMSQYQNDLIRYIDDNPDFIQPEFRKNEVLGFLKNPLGDLCISRPKSRLSWGIELPFDTDYVTYVWFDALTNYISAVGYPHNMDNFKKWWPANYHIIGKDILTTHAVYWPTMLMAAELPLPQTIFAHGWWLMGDMKMSKSLGNVVRPLDLIEKYGVDALRYFLMREMTPGQDSSFTFDIFINRYNSDLANDLGNLVNRITKLVGRFFDHKLPLNTNPTAEDDELSEKALALNNLVKDEMAKLRVNHAIDQVMSLLREVNRYMEAQAPWKIAKKDTQRAGAILYTATETLRLAAGQLYPIMPEKISALLNILGTSSDAMLEDKKWYQWNFLPDGVELGETSGLFPRIEADKKEQPRSKPKKKQTPTITFDEFQKVDIRIATILKVEKHPNADKLLKLQISLGDEDRQIIAGIAEFYTPEELVGKQVSIIANLKPVKIRGERSEGMILAADDGENVAPLAPFKEMKSGAKIS